MKFKFFASTLVLSLVIAISGGLADARDKNTSTYHKTNKSFDIVTNETYIAECGSCHFAYQPGLLPMRSWKKMMNTLEDHFGDDASIDKNSWAEIYNYLIAGSAELSNSKRAKKFLRYIQGSETPLRITETIYFESKHDEIRPDVFKRKSIGFAGNCIVCHTTADIGDYNDDFVKIPGGKK